MSAQRRGQIVDTVFESVGGVERLTDWAEKNYGTFIEKVWVKGLPRTNTMDHTLNANSVEAFWDKVTAAEDAQTIEGSCTPVEESNDETV
jgi:hypothetical protein